MSETVLQDSTYLVHLIGKKVRPKGDRSMQATITGLRKADGTIYLQLSESGNKGWFHASIADALEFV